jgi:hypothetical protein
MTGLRRSLTASVLHVVAWTGLLVSPASAVTAEDVKFSFERGAAANC